MNATTPAPAFPDRPYYLANMVESLLRREEIERRHAEHMAKLSDHIDAIRPTTTNA
jgi:hypothetical protein